MAVKSMCLCLTVICISFVSAYFPNYTILDAKAAAFVQNIIHNSDEIEGHDLATLHGLDLESGTHKRLTKRDVQVHAAHPYTDKRLFTFQFASGDRVRMSLVKRSVVTTDTKIVENFSDRREEYFLQSRDCYFLGPVEQENAGYASLGFCNGQVKGAFQTSNRTYEIYPLPESSDRHKRSADMHVLVTWTSLEGVAKRLGKAIDPPKEFMEPEWNEDIKPRVTRSVADKKVEIEVAVYLISAFIDQVKKITGASTTEELIDHTVIKWSGVQGAYSDPKRVGWYLYIRLRLIEIWRKNPAWYVPPKNTIGGHLSAICTGANNLSLKYDHIATMTSGTVEIPSGVAFSNGVCGGARCQASKSTRYYHLVESHELGHNLGLPHDSAMPSCRTTLPHGFMEVNPLHFLPCYREVLNRTLRNKECLFREDVPRSETQKHYIFPAFTGQNMNFDKQCRIANLHENYEFMVDPDTSICSRLTCVGMDPSKAYYGLVARNGPIPGTPCDDEKICNNGKCYNWNETAINPALQRKYKIPGCWGPWSEFSPCSRTCGTGVRISSRMCNRPEPFLAPHCSGNMHKAELCVRDACPNEPPELKEPQLVNLLANATCSSKPKDPAYKLTGVGQRFWGSGALNKCTVKCFATGNITVFQYLAIDGASCNGTDTKAENNTRLGIQSWNCVRGLCRAFGMNGKTIPEKMDDFFCSGCTTFDYTEGLLTLCSAYIVVFSLWHLVPGILSHLLMLQEYVCVN